MKLKRRDWPTRGWLYRFHKMIRWQLVKRFAFADAEAAAPVIVAPHEYWPDAMAMGDCAKCGNVREHPLHPPVAKPTMKQTAQLGFGF